VKKSQNVAQNIFLSKSIHELNRGKSGPKMWATFFQKTSEENNHPMGENSPNLVTLTVSHTGSTFLSSRNGIRVTG
jgi:hypothetical protein